MQVDRTFVFIAEQFQYPSYAQAYTYLYWVFQEMGLPCRRISRNQPYRTDDIPVLTFARPDIQNIRQPSIFLLLEAQINWYKHLHTQCNAAAYGLFIFTMHPSDRQWMQDRTNRPVYLLRQGYIPTVDPFATSDWDRPLTSAAYDISMPGMLNGPSRTQIINDLRAAGLSVDTKESYGPALTNHTLAGKITVCVPYNQECPHFYSQRILWAVNLGACVVCQQCVDDDSEQFYAPIMHSVPRCQIVDTCLELINNDKWHAEAERAYRTYRDEYQGKAIFPQELLDALRDLLVVPSFDLEPTRLHQHIDKALLDTFTQLCSQPKRLAQHLPTLHEYASNAIRTAEVSQFPDSGSALALVCGFCDVSREDASAALSIYHTRRSVHATLFPAQVTYATTIPAELPEVDMLFLDLDEVLLVDALSRYACSVTHYIILYGTGADGPDYCISGPARAALMKRRTGGLSSILDALPDWTVYKHYTNGGGLTIFTHKL